MFFFLYLYNSPSFPVSTSFLKNAFRKIKGFPICISFILVLEFLFFLRLTLCHSSIFVSLFEIFFIQFIMAL